LEADVLDAAGERTRERITVMRDEVPREASLEAVAAVKPVARDDRGSQSG
jgi:hypothetical protein